MSASILLVYVMRKHVRAMSRRRGPIKLRGVWWQLRKALWFAEMQIPRLRNMLLKHVASLGVTYSEEIRNANPGVRAKVAVCRVNFMVKLLRAHGGCLGRSRR